MRFVTCEMMLVLCDLHVVFDVIIIIMIIMIMNAPKILKTCVCLQDLTSPTVP